MKSYTFGTDYYPEHWPKERWPEDARMMREMGIEIVRMAEFSWQKFEPREGEFHFEDLDEAIEILASEGIDVILGTPSAAPPKWIIDRNPEIQPMDQNGLRRYFGSRHHDCQSNPVYREHIRRYVTAFAKHYAKNPHVVGWQVDNELGNSHNDLCYCDSCQNRFRLWLREKYETIERLNEAWGTAFWSQGYDDFESVSVPKTPAAGGLNPSLALDFKRFTSDLICEFHAFQAEILRKAAPDKFITHNLMGFCSKPNYYELGKQLDFASQDQYPGGHFLADPNAYHGDRNAAELDFIRSVKHQSFWVMEQQSGITGWEILGRAPRPGQLGLWAMQSVAHGADTIVFFRWRSCAMGTEQYWHGILPHNGVPGRYYRELSALMRKYAPLLQEMHGPVPKAEVAILRSIDQEYAIDIQPHHPDNSYISEIMTYYSALHRANIPVDFVSDEDDFSAYKVLIAPKHFLMNEAQAEKLKSFAENGGQLLLSWRSGIKDDTNLCHTGGVVPAIMEKLTGVKLLEYDCLRDTEGCVEWDGEQYSCLHWCDILDLCGAEVLAEYGHEFYKGTPAITRNTLGKGNCLYIGTTMDDRLSDRVVRELCGPAGVSPLLETPFGVEAAMRVSDNKEYLFLLNLLGEEQKTGIPAGFEPWDREAFDGTLSPYDVRVFVKELQ